jgi:hypothetical protein
MSWRVFLDQYPEIVTEARAKLNKEALAGMSFGPVGKPTTVCHTSLVAPWAVHNMSLCMVPAAWCRLSETIDPFAGKG